MGWPGTDTGARVERPTQNDAAVYQTAGDDNIKGVFFLDYWGRLTENKEDHLEWLAELCHICYRTNVKDHVLMNRWSYKAC